MIAAGIEYVAAGAGPPVVCLHGIGGGFESFSGQMPCEGGFAPPSASRRAGGSTPRAPGASSCHDENEAGLAGFRVIAWNMPGYGRSAAADGRPDFAGLSQALGRFVEALDLDVVHLVGHSIGGMVALEHALRRPGQVASLVLIGTTPSFGGRDDSFKRAFLSARLAPLEAGQSMAGMASEAARGMVGPNAAAEVIAAVETPMARVSEATWRGILQCLVTFNRRDDLGDVTQPCCLIAGGHDQNAPARTMEKMARALPRAEYHLIGEAGHMIPQEAPGKTNRIITDFLRKHA